MERQSKGNITGDMIKAKGRELAKQMGHEGKLGFSNGWLASFKSRHGLIKRNTSQLSAHDKMPLQAPLTTINPDGSAATTGAVGVDSNIVLSNGLPVDTSYILPPVSVDLSLEQIQEVLRDYEPSDIYTVDETGLFFRASPSKLLSQ